MITSMAISVHSSNSAPDTWIAEAKVCPSASIFAEHFPEYPVLPGAFIVGFVTEHSVEAFGLAGWPPPHIRRISFVRPISPGDHLTVSIQRTEERTVQFKIFAGADICTRGVLQFPGGRE